MSSTDLSISSEKPSELCSVDMKDTVAALVLGKSNSKKPTLYTKEFKVRDSCLTELWRNEHMYAVYNFVWCFILSLAIWTGWDDYNTTGRVYLGWRTIQKGFRRIEYAIPCWCLELAIEFAAYCGFKVWALLHHSCKQKNLAFLRHSFNLIALTLYVALQLLLICLCIACCLHYDLPFPLALALTMETVRLLMKTHAFVRSSTPQISNGTLLCCSLPRFSHYLYFHFAPTLIYHPSYPLRETPIDWRFMLMRLLEFLGIIFFYCYLYEQYISIYYASFGQESLAPLQVIGTYILMLPAGLLTCLCLFYLILHVVQNFFAELLRFGDRQFYRAWWTACSYMEYFRWWNCVVQDWIYEYLYKEICRYVTKSRFVISLLIFNLSALIHECIMSLSLQMFLPVHIVLFGGIGFLFTLIPKRMGNFLFLCNLMVGFTLTFMLYATEYYAKWNCPKEKVKLGDYLVPYIWQCIKKYKYD